MSGTRKEKQKQAHQEKVNCAFSEGIYRWIAGESNENQLNVDECYAIEYLAIYKDKRALNFRVSCICLEKCFHFKLEDMPLLSSP